MGTLYGPKGTRERQRHLKKPKMKGKGEKRIEEERK